MSNHSLLHIGNNDPFYGGWYVPYLHLILFKPSNYSAETKIFKTSVSDALKNLISNGLTLEKIEEKISNVIRLDISTLKKFRETGEKKILGSDEFDSVEIRLEIFGEDYPEIYEAYSILQQLTKCNDTDEATLDIEQIFQMSDEGEWYDDIAELFEESKNDYKESLKTIDLDDFKDYDVFISHDFNDKDFVAKLTKQLRDSDVKVWHADFELHVGDCLVDKIQEGLKKSRYGITVLSQNFINNFGWAKEEFESLKAKEKIEGKLLILPIWRSDVTVKDVGEYNYALSLRIALKEDDGLETIVDKLIYKISTSKS